MSVKQLFGDGETRYLRIIALLVTFIVGGGATGGALQFATHVSAAPPGVTREEFEASQAEQATIKTDVALLKQALTHAVGQLDHLVQQVDRIASRP